MFYRNIYLISNVDLPYTLHMWCGIQINIVLK